MQDYESLRAAVMIWATRVYSSPAYFTGFIRLLAYIALMPAEIHSSWAACSAVHVSELKVIASILEQGHREFPFGNSRESPTPKFPAGIPGNF